MTKIAHANIRMPYELKEKIDKSAEENGRSITSEIITRLEDSFKVANNSHNASQVKIFHFNDMDQPAMTVEIPQSVIGLMKSHYKDIQVEQNQLNGQWVLKYYALRCIISEIDAMQLIQAGAKKV